MRSAYCTDYNIPFPNGFGIQMRQAFVSGSLSVLKKCHDPDKYNKHKCLIVCPEYAHAIVFLKVYQSDKHPNDGYPIY